LAGTSEDDLSEGRAALEGKSIAHGRQGDTPQQDCQNDLLDRDRDVDTLLGRETANLGQANHAIPTAGT
jgi:hypothetical protein